MNLAGFAEISLLSPKDASPINGIDLLAMRTFYHSLKLYYSYKLLIRNETQKLTSLLLSDKLGSIFLDYFTYRQRFRERSRYFLLNKSIIFS